MDESQNIMLSKRSQTQKSTSVWFHFHETPEKTNVIFRDRADQWLFGMNVHMEDQTGRSIKRIVSGDGNAPYLDCGGGDVALYVCQTL